MSDPIFPITLPPPLAQGYAIERRPLTTSMDTDAGTKRVRAIYRTAPTVHSLTWKFTPAQYAVFSDFYEDELKAGSLNFICPLDDKAGGLLAIPVLFIEPPEEIPDDGMNWRVSAKVMTAGVALGKFPRLINVDGATGGEEPGGGSGGAQDPLREIHLENFSLKAVAAGTVHVIISQGGQLVMFDDSGQKQPSGLWKAITNTTPASEYSYSCLLTTIDYRDGSGIVGNDPETWSYPPTVYTTDPHELSVQAKDANVNSIIANRVTSLKASFYHPWIKYLMTLRVKDLTSGYEAIGLITIEIGTIPAGRELG